ncbi:MAG: response regulator with CheY-like receiver domain and winged-helix DNA-binding domain [Cyanobacteria bacterium RYN_339]|nr:response regulator with CheY-like receiver domain and winged-helix DNA-binding domain [Cyanobacteria bacterium RYN_339]
MTRPRAPRVLLVDDVEDNRGVIRQLTRRMGIELIEAADGLEGLRLARSEVPDLILMDLSLPGIDGWSATAQLKADPATAGIPVVAVTAHAMAGDEERARAVGMDGYVTKPIDLFSFRDLLEQMVRGGPA